MPRPRSRAIRDPALLLLAALYANGDFLNRDTIDAFEAYARFCFDEYPEVTRWFTFNEIAAATLNRYVEGTWPQGKKGCLHECLQAQHNMMLAHARAVLAYKQGGYPGTIGVIHALEYKYPYDPACL
ncbi:MAG: family 1 glycosylhydrolase [Collinsella aerofaciens]